LFDTISKKLEPITNRKDKQVIQSGAKFTSNPDEIFYLTDRNNEFTRLAQMNLKTGKVQYLTTDIP